MKLYQVLIAMLFVLVGCTNNSGSSVDNGDSITDAGLAPAVIWTDPMPNAIGPNIMSPNNVVRIRFNKLMNTHTVIHAATLTPSDESVYIDSLTAGPVEGTTFDFPLTPLPLWWVNAKDSRLDSRFPASYVIYYPSFKVAEQYTMTIDTTAEDYYGNSMPAPFSFSFTPEPYFRVTDTYPAKYDTGVSPAYSGITVRFNAVVDTSTVRAAFSLSPSAQGYLSVYSNSWGFYWTVAADNSLASETRYTATVATGMKDAVGHLLTVPYSFSFTTSAYGITYAYPTGSNVSLTSMITIGTNFAVDSTTMASSFTITPAVTGKYQYDGTSFQFAPSSSLVANTMYAVTVSRNLKAKNGTSIKNPFSFSFTTGSQ